MRSANLTMKSNTEIFSLLSCCLSSGQMKQNDIQQDDIYAKQINPAILKGYFNHTESLLNIVNIFRFVHIKYHGPLDVLKRFCYLKLLDDITYMRVHQTNFRWKNCKRQSL